MSGLPMNKRKQKEKEPVISEEELQRKHARWMAANSTIRAILTTAIICLFGWLSIHSAFYLPIQAAHGEITTISLAQNFLANIHADVYVAWGTAAGGVIFGEVQRRKRNRERVDKDARITELEKKLDPNRTSSLMTPGGETAQRP